MSMEGQDSYANESGNSSGLQQVMGGSSSGPSGMITRAQARGRADTAEHRTPASGRGASGGASIWTAAASAASTSSSSSGGPTEAMVALQQQMELILIQNQVQAKRQDELLALLGRQHQVVVSLQDQVQALTVEQSSRRRTVCTPSRGSGSGAN